MRVQHLAQCRDGGPLEGGRRENLWCSSHPRQHSREGSFGKAAAAAAGRAPAFRHARPKCAASRSHLAHPLHFQLTQGSCGSRQERAAGAAARQCSVRRSTVAAAAVAAAGNICVTAAGPQCSASACSIPPSLPAMPKAAEGCNDRIGEQVASLAYHRIEETGAPLPPLPKRPLCSRQRAMARPCAACWRQLRLTLCTRATGCKHQHPCSVKENSRCPRTGMGTPRSPLLSSHRNPTARQRQSCAYRRQDARTQQV